MTEAILRKGEFHAHERFGPETVNRGAVLWECEWDGGVFESGVMLGGIFRAGEFRDGVVWAAWWKGGVWKGGFWHHGFADDGTYRPRGAFPGCALSGAVVPESPIEESTGPRVTVFTASVFEDVPRIWLACLRRSLPPDDASSRSSTTPRTELWTKSSCRTPRCFGGRKSARTSRSRTATP